MIELHLQGSAVLTDRDRQIEASVFEPEVIEQAQASRANQPSS